MWHEACNAGQGLTQMYSVHKSTYRRTTPETAESGNDRGNSFEKTPRMRTQTVNFMDCSIPSPSLSCGPAGQEPSVPFRFATLPPSISGSHQLPTAASVGGWRYYRSDSARGTRSALRSMSADDDHEITCVRSSGDHVTGLDPGHAVIMPKMT